MATTVLLLRLSGTHSADGAWEGDAQAVVDHCTFATVVPKSSTHSTRTSAAREQPLRTVIAEGRQAGPAGSAAEL